MELKLVWHGDKQELWDGVRKICAVTEIEDQRRLEQAVEGYKSQEQQETEEFDHCDDCETVSDLRCKLEAVEEKLEKDVRQPLQRIIDLNRVDGDVYDDLKNVVSAIDRIDTNCY